MNIGFEFFNITMTGEDRVWKRVQNSRSTAKERFSVLDSTSEVGLEGELIGIPGGAGITVECLKGRNATGYFTRAYTVEVSVKQGET